MRLSNLNIFGVSYIFISIETFPIFSNTYSARLVSNTYGKNRKYFAHSNILMKETSQPTAEEMGEFYFFTILDH